MTRSRIVGRPLLALATAMTLLALLGGCASKEGGAPEDGQAAAGDSSPAPAGAPGDAAERPESGQPPESGSAGPGEAPSTPPGAGQSPAPPLVPSGPPGQVVARVNGTAITRGVLDFTLKNIVGNQGAVPADKQAQVRRQVLDQIIDQELIYQKASSAKITATDAEFSDSMQKVRAGFPDEAQFAQQLAKDGMDIPGIEKLIRQSIVVDKYVRGQIMPKVTVTAEEEAKFYDENKEKMKHPEQLRASHILLRVDQTASPEERRTQKARAEEALGRAKKGDDFAALAKQYSQDPGSAANGGDLGFFPRGRMVPAFEAAAWSLKVGQISEIVETPYGYHIIKLTERKPEGYMTLDEVRLQIRQYLTMQKTQADLAKQTQTLRAAAKIDVTL